MLERPPIVVPANVVPVGTIACPRNCSFGGFVPLPVPVPALAPTTPAIAAVATAATATYQRIPLIESPMVEGVTCADLIALGSGRAVGSVGPRSPSGMCPFGACPVGTALA